MNIDWQSNYAAVWRSRHSNLRPITHLDPIRLDELIGVEAQKNALCHNTERFLKNLPANNALLWGTRGSGKSSLVKALLNQYYDAGLRVIQMDRDDLIDLSELVDQIRDNPYRFIIFCDDLSFEQSENQYRALKTALEGSIEATPDNLLVYATSNRRHLVPESIQENLQSVLHNNEIHHTDSIEEKISLADRFGLWLSFYPINWDDYLTIVDSYFSANTDDFEQLHEAARQFALQRASHSGRTAKQFYQYWSQRQALS